MRGLLFFVILLVGTSTFAQDKVFPNDYLGVYQGDLVITNPQGKQTIPMEFHFKDTDSLDVFTYKLVYLVNDKPVEKDYILRVKNKSKGEFLIDENNGIILSANYIDNTLYSVFEVQNSLLTTTETFYDDKMEFKIVFSNMNDKTNIEGSEDTPQVTNYPVTVIQKAILTKQ
ncbi:hypothetical protein [uncultured Psychroserpens sp.]|uniref:hypothetical protein n=1 Tax=uncultured Psychroserpens sp. TaxID=255436 RepID=UPI00260639D2|nr:hypothetical protein [uncultured Psychroserpens sp.]